MTQTTDSAPSSPRSAGRGAAAVDTEFGPAILNQKGYPRLYRKPFRNRYVHRIKFETVAGRPIREGFQIHHQPTEKGKLCWCPRNLVEIQDVLHVKPEPPRCPWTGRFLDAEELRRMLS